MGVGDDDLIALAEREIGHMGLARPGDVVDGRVVRQPKAYPVYDDGYREMWPCAARLETNFPTFIWSAATACTNTIIRTTP